MHFKIKTIKGSKYLYLIEKAWIKGKSRQVNQIYIGSPDRVKKLVSGSATQSFKSISFGKVAALLHAAEKVGLIEAIDDNVSKKEVPGLSPGEYIFLLLAGRSDRVRSRAGIDKWFKSSVLKLLFKPAYQLSSQNCLNQMKLLDEKTVSNIEDTLTGNLLKLGISPNKLIFDTTNRFSYVEEGEDLFQHGNNKQKRFEKKIVGIALTVNTDNLPFLSLTYPGNENDAQVFNRIFTRICERLERIGAGKLDVALIFDRGMNSKTNIETVLGRMHVIGALDRSEAEELFRIPLEAFQEVYTNAKGHIISAYRVKGNKYSNDFDLVVTYNRATMERQKNAYERAKARIFATAKDLEQRCLRTGKGRRPSLKGIMNTLVDVIPKKYRGVLDIDIGYTETGTPIPFLSVNSIKEKVLYSAFGKTVIFTDNENYSTGEIVQMYNSKYLIEEDFKWLNDKVIIPVWPFFVRKDITVGAHVFICLVGLMLYRYLLWELKIDGLTVPKLSSMLEDIRLGIVIDQGERARFIIEQMDKDQIEVFSKLNLGRFIPN